MFPRPFVALALAGMVSFAFPNITRAEKTDKASLPLNAPKMEKPSKPEKPPKPPKPPKGEPPVGAGESGGSDSNASNMGGDASFQVNPRTGGVSLEAQLFMINGINEDADLSFSLTYQSEDAVSDEENFDSVFGLPFGWSMNLSYMENKNSYVALNADGNQQYVYDENWRTFYTPAGSAQPQLVLTGLKEYNRVDTNLQSDAYSVQVDGIPSAFKLNSMSGSTEYFSANGLLLEKVDRFGNTITFHYNGDAIPQLARLAKIVDSWGNEITFDYCFGGNFLSGSTQIDRHKLEKLIKLFEKLRHSRHKLKPPKAGPPGACSDGDVQIHLPDGRTVGWTLVGDQIRQIVDAQGKATVLNYVSTCSGAYDVLSAVTSPSGASAAIQYQCMNVCTRNTYPDECSSDYKQWPVAFNKYDCPSNPNGLPCQQGSAPDNLTTRFLIGGTNSSNAANNYTGYPFYSPYDAPDPAADALMQSNDNSFEYATTSQTVDSDGFPVVGEESHYNFLHLETETVHYVKGPQGNFPVVAKQTSNCYDLTGYGPQPGCQMTEPVDYAQLPANYQSPVMTGTCVYAVGGQPSSSARLSVVSMAYDGFGNLITRRAYHGTSSTGVVPDCSNRITRMDPSPLSVVMDSYLQYDTPVTVQGNFLVMGAGSKHYGLLSGALAFLYDDPDVGTAQSTAPVSVTLSCNTFTADSAPETAGTAVKTNLFGAVPLSTSAPGAPGVVAACTSPNWDESVAPPKLTTYTHDAAGRVVSVRGQWASNAAQSGIAFTQSSYSYALTGGASGEEACSHVLQKTTTDANGHQSVTRICTENSFPLSSADEEGRTVTYRHDQVGLAASITQPNGTSQQYNYYYACPIAQDGSTPTCPAGNTANGKCPYGDQGLTRSCVVTTMVAGAVNQSYADGVMSIMVNDGAGRMIQTIDNLGAAGSGYTAAQTRSRATYNDLGLLTSQSMSIGTSSPLVYTSTAAYGPKLRPIAACDAWGNSHQFVHDDVGQNVKRLINGHQLNRISMNDSQKLTQIEDCPVVATDSVTAGSDCPSVAADTQDADCSGNIYLTQIKRDGAGNQRGVTTSDPAAASTGASIASVSSAVTYSAELFEHGYSVQGTAVGSGQSVTANSAWQRDLNGIALRSSLDVTAGGSTSSFASGSFAFDALGNPTSETNRLGGVLTATNTFTPTRKLSTHTDYAGTVYHSYYDNMDWMDRHCYPAEGGGSQGEITTHDPLTTKALSIKHFTNPGACSACSSGNCGDVIDSSIDYTYTRFDAVASKTYKEDLDTAQPRVTVLNWAYDQYQRPVCFADAAATRAGYNCPPSPVASDWQPTPAEQLTRVTFWPDNDPYRRGMMKSTCKGIPQQQAGSLVYEEECVETDYYTSVDTDGACNGGPNSQGAYAGLLKTRTMCLGGSCDGGGSLVYRTTYQYDPHRRGCSVQNRNPTGQAILASSYLYDQYDNLINESHSSELDASADSNYRTAYTYDGLLRLVFMSRSDTDGNPLETIAYEYDAASNITKKVKTAY